MQRHMAARERRLYRPFPDPENARSARVSRGARLLEPRLGAAYPGPPAQLYAGSRLMVAPLCATREGGGYVRCSQAQDNGAHGERYPPRITARMAVVIPRPAGTPPELPIGLEPSRHEHRRNVKDTILPAVG